MTPLAYVGLAYGIVWALIFVYAWRLTARAKTLSERLDRIENRP